jgi:hypothetical protein
MEDITTSEEEEYEGSDDSMGADYETDSEIERNQTNDAPPDNNEKELVRKLLLEGHQGPKVLVMLHEKGINMSARTLTRRRLEWGLRECDLPQINRTVAIDPPIRASLVSSHSKGLNIAEIHARLEKETGFQLSIRTVKRYLKKLDLKQVINDVQDEKVTLHQVHEAIDHARNFLGYNNAGYCRMRTILVRQYSIRIPRLVNISFLQLKVMLNVISPTGKWFTTS